MEHTSRPSTAVTPWGYSPDADRLALPTILLVEDDRDARDMISSIFEIAGFAVVACDCAEPALDALREQEFDLILTDYALPRHSGLWLLRTAEAEGLLQGTPALIVTAHPRIEDEEAYEVIRKPFDLDELVQRVRLRLESDKAGRPRRTAPTPAASRDSSGSGPAAPDPVELILYVNANSPKADAAVEQMRRVLERFNSQKVTVTVCPLPEAANCAVAAASPDPAVPVRQASARTLILGHITHPEILLEMLRDCDFDLKQQS